MKVGGLSICQHLLVSQVLTVLTAQGSVKVLLISELIFLELPLPVDFSKLTALACGLHTFPTNISKLGYLNNNILLLNV